MNKPFVKNMSTKETTATCTLCSEIIKPDSNGCFFHFCPEQATITREYEYRAPKAPEVSYCVSCKAYGTNGFLNHTGPCSLAQRLDRLEEIVLKLKSQ
jgi:hypothetical protein